MPSADILRRSPIYRSFRTESVRGMFDVPHKDEITQQWSVNLPIQDREWNIGLIVGASGSGKTTIASELFKNDYIHTSFDWPSDKSMLDAFDKRLTTKEIVQVLSSIGLS